MFEIDDPNLLADFLTEAGELIEQLDGDLVQLEREGGSPELLNQVFRALHTIKGAASFLNLSEITSFTHVAEDALNLLRKGAVDVTPEVVDALLRSVDVVREQLAELGAGEQVTEGPADLMASLKAIAESTSFVNGSSGKPSREQELASVGVNGKRESDLVVVALRRPLVLSAEKADIVSMMNDELINGSEDLEQCAHDLEGGEPCDKVVGRIDEVVTGLTPTAEFFGIEGFSHLVDALKTLSVYVKSGASQTVDVAADSIQFASMLLRLLGEAFGENEEIVWEADILDMAMRGTVPKHQQSESPAQAQSNVDAGVTNDAGASFGKGPTSGSVKNESIAPEQTVRVEVGRLEALLNLVGELVLAKNQILGISRQLRSINLPQEVMESINGAMGDLDRLTGEMQMGVMRTRMQPMSKLFGRYPRVVRDLARIAGKEIGIEITGGETEVDKSVLEQLADPMVHILRNSADHGIGHADEREANGKPRQGTIHIHAAHEGGHIRVEITDDGRGIDPVKVGAKAVEKGLRTEEQVAQMSEEERINLIFAPGFSMAEEVSDLSGRGVGMDVVQTNIKKLAGSIRVRSNKGRGTSIEVLIPLTVAIMQAMLVKVGRHRYSVPVASIVEIVRIEVGQVKTVAGGPVIRLRDGVLPLVFVAAQLGEQVVEGGERFAVVVEVGQQRAGLAVDDLVGQQEVVIKPLDDRYTLGGPFSGATILDDGCISLILDVNELVHNSQQSERQAA